MRVNRDLFKAWLALNGPDGVARLATYSRISSATIQKVRSGYVPKKPSTRLMICQAMGLPESDLFPEAEQV